MDSVAINKLIRQEIWPLLKAQGFSTFESRTAFRYRDPFIDVVNFQSFNSHLAEGLHCTTASFCLNLAVYVHGSERDPWVTRDKKGRARPREYECEFRAKMEKRSCIDGFERKDIFFIDKSGSTTAACINEVCDLLRSEVPAWFTKFSDVNTILDREERDSSNAPSKQVGWARGSALANLRLIAAADEPSTHKTSAALATIEGLISALFNMSLLLDTPVSVARSTHRIQNLLDRLNKLDPSILEIFSSINFLDWDCHAESLAPVANNAFNPSISRDTFWSLLRIHGFTDFSARLAHRIHPNHIDVIEVLPADRYEIRNNPSLAGTFTLIAGVFWLDLREEGLYRKVSGGKIRPTAREAHLTKYLSPIAFRSTDEAIEQIKKQAFPWFSQLATPESSLAYLSRPDLDRFISEPLMRGLGSSDSCIRFLALAVISKLARNDHDISKYLNMAKSAIDSTWPEHRRSRVASLCDTITERILTLPNVEI